MPTRTCGTRAEGPDRLPTIVRSRDLVLGRLVIAGAADGLLVQGDLVKAGVLVRTGGPVKLRITPIGAARARLAYAGPETGTGAVRFQGCPPNTRRFSDGRSLGPWTLYAGGFVVTHIGCARVTATARGQRRASAVVALGVPVSRCR